MRAFTLPFLAITFLLFAACADDETTEPTSCNQTVTLSSYTQRLNILKLQYTASGPVLNIQASIAPGNTSPDEGTMGIVANNEMDLEQLGIPQGNYILYLRTVCEDGTVGVWTTGAELSVNKYQCVEPYKIRRIDHSAFGNPPTTFVYWYEGVYDYARWEYVIVNEGEPLSSGTVQTTNTATIPQFSSTGRDLYIRGVCGGGTYTEWIRVL